MRRSAAGEAARSRASVGRPGGHPSPERAVRPRYASAGLGYASRLVFEMLFPSYLARGSPQKDGLFAASHAKGNFLLLGRDSRLVTWVSGDHTCRRSQGPCSPIKAK